MDSIKELIIYEDNYIIVLNKPSGINTMGPKNSNDFLHQIKDFLKKRDNKPGNVFLGLVHRLDRETSGVMVFAKNSKSARRMGFIIKNKMFFKVYLGILENEIGDFGRVDTLLWKNREENKTYVLFVEDRPKVKRGITDFVRIYNNLYAFLPFSGRPHQIRAHSAFYGSPLYGDIKYGSKYPPPFYLHSFILAFPHPKTKKLMFFRGSPPQRFLKKVRTLGIKEGNFLNGLRKLYEFIPGRYHIHFPYKNGFYDSVFWT